MLPVYQSFNGTTVTLGPQTPISIDFLKAPINVTVAVWITTAATYNVEFTLDDVSDPLLPPDMVPRWFPDDNLGMAQTISQTTLITYPCRFIRVNIQALSGTLEFKVMQALSSSA